LAKLNSPHSQLYFELRRFHFGNEEEKIREEDQFQAHRDQGQIRQEGRSQKEERGQEEVGPA